MNNGINHYNLIQDANPAYIIYLPDFYQIDNPPVKMLKKSHSSIQQNEMSVTSWNYQSLNIRSDPRSVLSNKGLVHVSHRRYIV